MFGLWKVRGRADRASSGVPDRSVLGDVPVFRLPRPVVACWGANHLMGIAMKMSSGVKTAILSLAALAAFSRPAAAQADTLSLKSLTVRPIARPPAEPFGIRLGLSRADAGKVMTMTKTQEPDMFLVERPPAAHPDFERYMVLVDDSVGVCKITAIGVSIPSNSFGTQTRERFDDVERSLREKYGAAPRIDFLRRGSIWDEPRDWMMGLAKEDRTLMTAWLRDDSSRFPDNLATILLKANATSSSSGWLSLSYEHPAVSQCLARQKRKKSSVL